MSLSKNLFLVLSLSCRRLYNEASAICRQQCELLRKNKLNKQTIVISGYTVKITLT